MQTQLLTPELLGKIDQVIEEVRNEPMFIRDLLKRAVLGEEVLDHYTFVVTEAQCCDQYMWHQIEGASFRDSVVAHSEHPKMQFLRNASVADLLEARQRLIAGLRNQAA